MALRTIGTGGHAYTEKSKHLTGVPRSLVEGVRAFVLRERVGGNRVTHGAVYGRAVREFMDAWRTLGERPVIEAQVRGERSRTVQFWAAVDLIDEFEVFCAEIGRDQSPTFIAALRRFIQRAAVTPPRGKGRRR